MAENKPIIIFKGDDTDAFGLRTLTIELTGDLSLDYATASFTMLSYKKEWTNEETRTGVLKMVFTAEQTKAFPLGRINGTFRLYRDKKQLTVVNTIPFCVTDKVIGVPEQEYFIKERLSCDTVICIRFTGCGESCWSMDGTGTFLYPKEETVQRVVVPALANVAPLGTPYTLADVKTLVNTILASLKE